MGECGPAQIAWLFLKKRACVKASTSETLWSGISKPQVGMSCASLSDALNHKNTELLNRPGEGMQELARSTEAVHSVYTENADVWRRSLAKEWMYLYEKTRWFGHYEVTCSRPSPVRTSLRRTGSGGASRLARNPSRFSQKLSQLQVKPAHFLARMRRFVSRPACKSSGDDFDLESGWSFSVRAKRLGSMRETGKVWGK